MKYQVMDEFGTVLFETNDMPEAIETAEAISADVGAMTYIYDGNDLGIAYPFVKAA